MLNRALTPLVTLLLIVGAVVCFGPWYETRGALAFTAAVKLSAEAAGAVFAILVARRYADGEKQRWPWWILGVSLALWFCGQAVIAYHQVALGERTPFPSWGDPPFVIGCGLTVAALVLFAVQAFRSGLPLGGPLLFWSPALAVGLLLLVGAYPIFAPILRAGGGSTELFLNVYYPLASFLSLAPCAVMLRVGIAFRGGRLLWVWLTLTFGFVMVLSSDILFSYLTTLGLSGLKPVMDLLYFSGYLLIARGVVYQWHVMRQ